MNTNKTTKPESKIVTTAWLADTIVCDHIAKRKGNFIFRRGFFYTNGGTSKSFADCILSAVTGELSQRQRFAGMTASIVNHGEQWKPFKGGAPLVKQSHWWVEIAITPAM